MSTVRLCRACGAPLPGDAPEGLCPQCLMKAGAQDSSAVRDGSREIEHRTSNVEHSTLNEPAGSDTTRISPRTTDHGPRTTIRYFGDYELLEEIARGGMGVVYKARQVSLHRIVAVKMILAGQLASETEVKRFHTEAEAAANLQHPNIVAIHEVGEHEGLHYFSMDYVEGKNLAQSVAEGPLLGMKAAGLVKLMAEAIQYAHQRGILHRDLKPQNILLDEREQPRITDFGLAKRIERERSLTVTGAVMGSPGYMAPEQAAGCQDEIGPPTDVYGLGAILYHLLTGRAPFSGSTAVETMVKVVEVEPVSPRKHCPSVPVDLETVCLKCLEKRPEKRYVTGRALAEDLERFLNHEPVLARPASLFRKSWSWAQRHPWVLAGALSLLLVGVIGLAYGLWEQNRHLLWLVGHPGRKQRIMGPDQNALFRKFPWWMLLGIPSMVGLYYRKRKGLAILSVHLWAYAVVGLILVALGIDLVRVTIYGAVWEPWRSQFWAARHLATGLWIAYPSCWLGLMVVWQVIREHQAAAFGFGARDELRPLNDPSVSGKGFREETRSLRSFCTKDHARVQLVLGIIVVVLLARLFVPAGPERTAFYVLMPIFPLCFALVRDYNRTRGIARQLALLWILFVIGLCLLLLLYQRRFASVLLAGWAVLWLIGFMLSKVPKVRGTKKL